MTATTTRSTLPAALVPSATVALDASAHDQTLATLQARAALVGWTLCTMHETDRQSFYMLSRWGMSRTLADLAAVAVFLRQVGAPC